jgi:hypothetical protein
MSIAVGTRVTQCPHTEPDGRSLAHPVLISDEWRRSEHRERDGALAVEEAIVELKMFRLVVDRVGGVFRKYQTIWVEAFDN